MSRPAAGRALGQAWWLHLRHHWRLSWMLGLALVAGLLAHQWVDAGMGRPDAADVATAPVRVAMAGVPASWQADLAKHGVVAGPADAPYRLAWETPAEAPQGRFVLSARLGTVAPFVQQRVDLAVAAAGQARLEGWAADRGFEGLPTLVTSAPPAPKGAAAPPLATRLTLALMATLMIALFLGGTLGLDWDVQRAAANLETWATSVHPLWVLYGSQALARATFALLMVGVGGAPLVWGTPALGGSAAVGAWAYLGGLAFCLTLLSAMWSLLATMLFHHRYGRLFARALLSPMGMLFAAMLAFTLLGSRRPVSAEDKQRAAETLVTHSDALTQWAMVLAAGVPLAALGAALALVPLVEWRIGVRRRGLRKL